MEIINREDREQILVTKELCHNLTVFQITADESVVISRTDDARVVLLSIQNNSDDYDVHGEQTVVLTPNELRDIANHMIKLANNIEGFDLDTTDPF